MIYFSDRERHYRASDPGDQRLGLPFVHGGDGRLSFELFAPDFEYGDSVRIHG